MTETERTEKNIALGFLEFVGQPFRDLQSQSEWEGRPRQFSGPDIKVLIQQGETWKRIGIEVKEYHGDKGPNGSKSAPACRISGVRSNDSCKTHIFPRTANGTLFRDS